MEIPFDHVLRYTNQKDIPIYDIAASLIATDELKDFIPPILEKLFPGLVVQKIELNLVQSAVSGSRKDDYTGRLLFQFQEDIERGLTRLAAKTGIDALRENKRLLSYLILALVLAGAVWAYEQFSGSSSGTHVEGDYNTVLNLTAQEAGVTADDLRAAIESALNEREKKRVRSNAIDIASPAKREDGATIRGAPDQSIELQPETIRQIPSHSDAPEDEDKSEAYRDLEIDVRRVDRDERAVGWVGRVRIGNFTGRVKMVLVPGINPEKLRDLTYQGPIKADVEVFFRRTTGGEFRPYVMHVYRVPSLDNVANGLVGKDER